MIHVVETARHMRSAARSVAHAMVESGDAGDGAAGGFVESGAVDAVGYG